MTKVDAVEVHRDSNRRRMWLLLFAALFAAVLGFVFFFLETQFSLATIRWHRKFEHALAEQGFVELGSLVSFKWDRVYLLGVYQPEHPEDAKKIFAVRSLFDPFWWQDSQRYWTIAYTRPGHPSFLVRMDTNQWVLRSAGRYRSDDPLVQLRIVTPETVEATWCPTGHGRCLAVDDSTTSIPNERQGRR